MNETLYLAAMLALGFLGAITCLVRWRSWRDYKQNGCEWQRAARKELRR